VSDDSASARFWLELEAVYQAAGRPTLQALVRLGREQHPPIPISASAINGWLTRKAVPAGQKNTRYLTVMVAFLQARVRPGAPYTRLTAGEWGRLLRAAQVERAAGKKMGRPRRPDYLVRRVNAGGIAAREHARRVPVVSGVTLIGRDSELAMLARLVAEVAAGRGSVLLAEGEPGIGKTALVQSALAGAASLGCQVFWGTGTELDQALPFQPLLDGLGVRETGVGPRREAMARFLRGEAVTDRGLDGPAVLGEQLLALIAEECAAQPTIMIVDDLQWADQATIRLLARLATSARDLPLFLVGMLRPVPRRDDLRVLRRAAGDAARLQLARLADPEVAQLVAALADGAPDRQLLRLVSDAGGNPLYVTELVAALARGSKLASTAAGEVTLTADPPPRSLAAAIADRLDFISGPVRAVLQSASLLGVEFDVTDLATLQGRPIAELAGSLRDACAAGVLTESGDRLRFRHPLIHAALCEQMPAPVRAAWHRDAGRVLADAGAPADRVARQLLSAAGGPDSAPEPMPEWMLSWLADAAELLVSQAPSVAAALLARAVDSIPVGSLRYRWLASRLANALYHTGENAAADQLASRILEQAGDPDLVVDLLWTLTLCRSEAGQPAESLAALDCALSTPGLSSRHVRRLLVLTARTHVNSGELEKAGRAAADAIAAEEEGDRWSTGWATHVLAMVATLRGDLAEALALYDRGLVVTRADPALSDLRLLFQINRAVALGNLDQHEEVLAAAAMACQLAEQVGTTIRQAQARCVRAEGLFVTGRWDDALAEMAIVPEGLKQHTIACVELGMAAMIAFHRGDLGAARSYLSVSELHLSRLGKRLIPTLALARSLDYEQSGALPEALAALTDWLESKTEELLHVQDLIADAARLANKCGDLITARAIADHANESARQLRTPYRQANALYCQGLLDHAAPLLLAAAERYRDASRPLQRAMALEAAAAAYARAGDLASARAALDTATQVYTSLGATVDAARAQASCAGTLIGA
jgi:tetratricopeptide (TPR) repeat protein